MAVNLSMLAGAGAQFFDNNGVILSGGLIYTYAAGTTTPQATYTTSSGSTAHTNPIVLDSAGRVPSGGEIWLTDSVAYKFVLKTSAAVTIGTYDNVPGNASGIYATFAASSGSSLVGYLPAGGSAAATTVQAKLRETVSVKDFGAVGDGSTNDTTAFVNAITAMAAVKGCVTIPSGTYILTAGTNFLIGRDVSIVGIGTPILKYSGTGIGFKLDAGGSGANYRGIHVENLIIVGSASITDGFWSRGLVGSVFKNIEVRECSATGFNLKFSILCTYENCRVSNDSLAMTTSPSVYFLLGNDSTAGNRCQANTFINCDASGAGATSTKVGWRLLDASVNTWVGGTAESLDYGIVIDGITPGSVSNRLNTFINVDIEDCNTLGLSDTGTNNTYVGMDFASPIDMFGDGATFSSGSISKITLKAGSKNTTFSGVGLDSSIGIVPVSGCTYNLNGCFTVNTYGEWVANITDLTQGSLATGSIGYTTGAGGNVVQTTSRTTGVTINNVCGAISLVSAAGTTAWQSFTVTNSIVAATDTIIINQQSGTDLYIVQVTKVSAGSFRVSFATTGGTTTESPVFSFAVIKSVFS